MGHELALQDDTNYAFSAYETFGMHSNPVHM